MAKFLKSIFHGPEKKKRYEEGEDDRSEVTPVSDRRKLSISRSGRLRQANKKRHSLTLDLYGENIQLEKPKSIEYHVHNTASQSEPMPDRRQRRRSADYNSTQDLNKKDSELEHSRTDGRKRPSTVSKSPEEEIDSAFEIIDRS